MFQESKTNSDTKDMLYFVKTEGYNVLLPADSCMCMTGTVRQMPDSMFALVEQIDGSLPNGLIVFPTYTIFQ